MNNIKKWGGIKITRPNFHIIEGTNVNEQQLYTQFKHYYINHTDTSVPQIIKKLNITRGQQRSFVKRIKEEEGVKRKGGGRTSIIVKVTEEEQ